MRVSPNAVAEKVEGAVHATGIGFFSEASYLYSVVSNDNGVALSDGRVSGTDPYEILASTDAKALAVLSDAIALVVAGWAAPVDDSETAPSKHAERRRVRLTIVANRNEVASVMRFENDDETVVDYGTAHGSLADALNEVTRLMLA